MTFREEDLVKYISKAIVPKEAMMQLNQLLFKELREFCDICEDDRMICVLSPQCPKRILLKVRIQSGAKLEDLPKFCYSQAVNNIKRYLNKNTTLYTPKDELIYNPDFLDAIFPRLQKKILKHFQKDKKLVHEIIKQSKVPAVHLDIHHADRDIFNKIRNKDKLIREGTFIYDIVGEFLLVWFEGNIFICNFRTGITNINAQEDLIEDLHIINLVFHIYCSENNIVGQTTLNSDNQMTLTMKIPFTQILESRKDPAEEYFQKLLSFLQEYFFEISISLDDQSNLAVSMHYKNIDTFLTRTGLKGLTYNTIQRIVESLDGLRKDQ
jgi:hypothetical protein